MKTEINFLKDGSILMELSKEFENENEMEILKKFDQLRNSKAVFIMAVAGSSSLNQRLKAVTLTMSVKK